MVIFHSDVNVYHRVSLKNMFSWFPSRWLIQIHSYELIYFWGASTTNAPSISKHPVQGGWPFPMWQTNYQAGNAVSHGKPNRVTRHNKALFVVPSDGVFTRRHTAECAFCIVFYSVFCFSTMLPWGGEGGARNNCFFEWCSLPLSICTGFYSVFRAFALLFFCTICVVPWFLQCFQASWRRWCYATLGWGGC